MDCVFCQSYKDKSNVILSNELAFVIKDKYPQSKGHVLIIPIRHFENYFETAKEEQEAMSDLLFKMKDISDKNFNPAAYNISINAGKSAGQIIMHAHIHLIPRY
ncbi:MAG TPA: HIT family protein [Ignavibacteria bacterium]|nr:HIT family protein [Ignavibacteria bacterium]